MTADRPKSSISGCGSSRLVEALFPKYPNKIVYSRQSGFSSAAPRTAGGFDSQPVVLQDRFILTSFLGQSSHPIRRDMNSMARLSLVAPSLPALRMSTRMHST